MALGKAFIEVHADTKPFARELGRELNKIVEAAEAEVRVSSRRVGETISTQAGEGIRRNRGKVADGVRDAVEGTSGLFARLAKGIIDTIDDGLSGLPAELKLILGAGIAALLPFVVALGSAIATALISGITIGGLAGIGALLAAQFTEVRDAISGTFIELRTQFLEGSRFLVRPFLNAIDMVRDRFGELQTELVLVFERAGRVIVPVVDAMLGLAEQALPGINAGLANIDKFMAPLQVGFRLIGQAIGQFFETILANDDAPEAFYDLLIAIEDLIQFFTVLIDVSLDFYGVLRDIFEFLGFVEPYSRDIEKFAEKFGIAGDEAVILGRAIEGTIEPTEAEVEALEEFNTHIDRLTRGLLATQNNAIAFEQAIDDLTESVQENGRTLDIHEQSGRNNARALLELANVALRTRAEEIALSGNVEQAEAAFQRQRTEIYRLARQMGLSEQATEDLVGQLLRIPPPKNTGVTPATVTRLLAALSAARSFASILAVLGEAVAIGAGIQPHADGGVFNRPHVGLVAEAGPEAIIPLNNPARAQQVMNEAGLSGMSSPVVNVYIGNQQLDTYIDARVDSRLTTTARSLAYGGRGI